jgi:hypothetical protein
MASGVRAGAAPEVAFLRYGGICRSDVFITYCKPGPDCRFPVGSRPSPEARRKETRLPIVATSSGRLFLDRVGRHQSPSPLHRHTQFNMHFSQAPPKGDISTLPAGGHFYFALTIKSARLTLPTGRSSIPSERVETNRDTCGSSRFQGARSWSQVSLARIRTVRALNRLENLFNREEGKE